MKSLNKYYAKQDDTKIIKQDKTNLLNEKLSKSFLGKAELKIEDIINLIENNVDVVDVISNSVTFMPSYKFSIIESRIKCQEAKLTIVNQYVYSISILEPLFTGFIVKEIIEKYQYVKHNREKEHLLYQPVLVKNPNQEVHSKFYKISRIISQYFNVEFIDFNEVWKTTDFLRPKYVTSDNVKLYHLLFGNLNEKNFKFI